MVRFIQKVEACCQHEKKFVKLDILCFDNMGLLGDKTYSLGL